MSQPCSMHPYCDSCDADEVAWSCFDENLEATHTSDALIFIAHMQMTSAHVFAEMRTNPRTDQIWSTVFLGEIVLLA